MDVFTRLATEIFPDPRVTQVGVYTIALLFTTFDALDTLLAIFSPVSLSV